MKYCPDCGHLLVFINEYLELMKEPEKRSEKIKEYIKVTEPGAVDRPLSKDKGVKENDRD